MDQAIPYEVKDGKDESPRDEKLSSMRGDGVVEACSRGKAESGDKEGELVREIAPVVEQVIGVPGPAGPERDFDDG